ncbi:MAG UNVERIFIED_CONTAM: hypothetical protein LVR18_02895 [Planctomycetaceae bacterium]
MTSAFDSPGAHWSVTSHQTAPMPSTPSGTAAIVGVSDLTLTGLRSRRRKTPPEQTSANPSLSPVSHEH